jgi:hypothetical protein
VHVDVNDVFWMIPLSDDAVDVDFEDAKARLHMRRLKVFDDHDLANSLTYGLGLPGDLGFPYPQIAPVPPRSAIVSFDVVWDGAVTSADIHNPAQQFMGSFLAANTTIKWSVEQPGFRFESEDPPDPSRNLISVLGREQNGVFFA